MCLQQQLRFYSGTQSYVDTVQVTGSNCSLDGKKVKKGRISYIYACDGMLLIAVDVNVKCNVQAQVNSIISSIFDSKMGIQSEYIAVNNKYQCKLQLQCGCQIGRTERISCTVILLPIVLLFYIYTYYIQQYYQCNSQNYQYSTTTVLPLLYVCSIVVIIYTVLPCIHYCLHCICIPYLIKHCCCSISFFFSSFLPQ